MEMNVRVKGAKFKNFSRNKNLPNRLMKNDEKLYFYC